MIRRSRGEPMIRRSRGELYIRLTNPIFFKLNIRNQFYLDNLNETHIGFTRYLYWTHAFFIQPRFSFVSVVFINCFRERIYLAHGLCAKYYNKPIRCLGFKF
jgi:hypothetical protein